MAEIETVTDVSTPDETLAEETSEIVEPEQSDTSTIEPEANEVAAETETETQAEPPAQEQKLYAGKYKSIEDFEKGYKELQGSFTKSREFENKYNELLKQQQEQAEKMRAYQLQQANQRGFQTTEDAQIADRVQLAEFQYYWTNLNTLNPEYANDVKTHLEAYYQTGNRAYLEEAKRYYSSDFIERVALAKNGIEQNLRHQLENYQHEQKNKAEIELANTLKSEFGEFLTDLKENKGKAKALEMFCNAGFINSSEDMGIFKQIVDEISTFAKEQAIKEYEAQKTIEETKNKAVIPTNNSINVTNTRPKASDIPNMTQKQFDEYCKKYGEDWIWA